MATKRKVSLLIMIDNDVFRRISVIGGGGGN